MTVLNPRPGAADAAAPRGFGAFSEHYWRWVLR